MTDTMDAHDRHLVGDGVVGCAWGQGLIPGVAPAGDQVSLG